MCNLSEGIYEDGIHIGQKGENERKTADNIRCLSKNS